VTPAPDPLARAYHRSLALRWLATVLPMPALVPLLLARGLELPEVALVLAAFAAVAAVLEVPTGGLADALGRVRVTLIADVLAVVGRVGFLLAPTPTAFIAAAAVSGAARALGSGSLEAWYVDARRRLEPEGDLRRPLARAGVVQALALGLGTLVGGAVPLLAPHLGLGPSAGIAALQLVFGASAALGVIALLTTAPLRDADAGPLAGRAAARPDRVASDAWRTLRADGSLTGLIALGAASGALVMTFEAFYAVELAARWGAGAVTPVLGVALAGAFMATALGQSLAGRLPPPRERSRPLRAAATGHTVMALATLTLAATLAGGVLGAALAVAALWLVYFGLGLSGPSVAAAFHGRVPSARRAALLSVRSLAGYAGGVAATVTLGAVGGAHGLPLVWLTAASVAVLAALGLASWRPSGRAVTSASLAPTAPAAPGAD
jgi:hypothetical protein